jgi:hypothetical protein
MVLSNDDIWFDLNLWSNKSFGTFIEASNQQSRVLYDANKLFVLQCRTLIDRQSGLQYLHHRGLS